MKQEDSIYNKIKAVNNNIKINIKYIEMIKSTISDEDILFISDALYSYQANLNKSENIRECIALLTETRIIVLYKKIINYGEVIIPIKNIDTIKGNKKVFNTEIVITSKSDHNIIYIKNKNYADMLIDKINNIVNC